MLYSKFLQKREGGKERKRKRAYGSLFLELMQC